MTKASDIELRLKTNLSFTIKVLGLFGSLCLLTLENIHFTRRHIPT